MKIEIEIEELRKRKLMLATPMYGGAAAGLFTRSAMELAAQMAQTGVQLQTYFLFNESLITRARNYCCDEFMRSDCTHMIFIDSDIGFNPQDVMFMLAMMSEDSPYDVMTGPYPKKCISWEKVKRAVDKGFGDKNPNNLENFIGDYVFNPAAGTKEIPVAEPSEVLEAGTGFMMIKKSAMQKFHDAYAWNRMYRPDHVRTAQFDGTREIMMYFQAAIDRYEPEGDYQKLLVDLRDQLARGEISGMQAEDLMADIDSALAKTSGARETESKRYLSEDYLFCQDARKIGLKIWFCPWMRLQHVGSYIFGGSLADIAALGVSATADVSMLRPQQKSA